MSPNTYCIPHFVQLSNAFHIFIRTIPNPADCQTSKNYFFVTLLTAQPAICSSWVVVTIVMSQPIVQFHFTASHIVCHCVTRYVTHCVQLILVQLRQNISSIAPQVRSLHTVAIERDMSSSIGLQSQSLFLCLCQGFHTLWAIEFNCDVTLHFGEITHQR